MYSTIMPAMPAGKLPIIGIDCRFASTHSGIGRYTRELIRHLLRRNDPWQYVLFTLGEKNHGLDHLLPHERAVSCQLSAVSYSLREHWELPLAIRRSGVSLMHFLHFNVPGFCSTPFVATIHDLILHRFPNEAPLPKRLAYQLLIGKTVKKAMRLIAVSRATFDDLARTYGESVRQRTSVIYEGISESFRPASEEEKQRVRKKYHLTHQRFILYVGAAKEHKNVQILIDACHGSRDRRGVSSPPDQILVLVTSGKEVKRLKLRENVRVLSSVPDEDLPALYSTALCFASASLAEGFNFPVLEAMACGCPVVASNRGSTPEICGNHVVLVEPTMEGLTKGIGQVLNELGATSDKRKAPEHARSFSWERTAEETATLYAQLIADFSPHSRSLP
jgi:glycosyltransferase involved in cell wall biosynthesis